MRYEINFTRLTHREGTKKYTIDFIEREDGAVLLIFQWGKRGTRGQLQSHFFKPDEHKRAHAMCEKKVKDKKARGYADDFYYTEHPRRISSAQELQGFYGASFDSGWWLRIPENHRKLITSDILDSPDAQELTALQSATIDIDMAALYTNHPLYGRF